MLIESMNSHLNLQRYKVLYISGNYSRILSRPDRNFTDLEIRRAFTSFRLMTILEENHHSFLIVENDPMLYGRCQGDGRIRGRGSEANLQGGDCTALFTRLGSTPADYTDLDDMVFCFL